MFNTKMSQKGKVLALFAVLSFAIAGLAAAVTLHLEQYVTAQSPQSNPYDPNICFGSNVTQATCLTHSHSNSQNQTDIVDCFKKIEETVSGAAQTENYTKTVQNFNSLIPTNNDIALINTAASFSSLTLFALFCGRFCSYICICKIYVLAAIVILRML